MRGWPPWVRAAAAVAGVVLVALLVLVIADPFGGSTEGGGGDSGADARLKQTGLLLGGGVLRVGPNPSPFNGPIGLGYVIPGSIGKIGSPPSDDAKRWRAWAYDQGGVDAFSTDVRTVFEGAPGGRIALDGIDIDVSKRRPPLAGTWVRGRDPHCPRPPRREIFVDLDSDPPQIVSSFTKREGKGMLYPLERGRDFHVVAIAARGMYEWRLRLTLKEGNKRRTVPIDDGGRPFRTSAPPPTGYAWYSSSRFTTAGSPSWHQATGRACPGSD
jgi:hypothetical protein